MTRDPILTIGDLEPERPTVRIIRRVPDGWWQRLKFEHLDVLLRWFPVRFVSRDDLYELRAVGEFGLRGLARLRAIQAELQGLAGNGDAAAGRRMAGLLRQLSGMVLDAPADVLDSLTGDQHVRILQVFPAAVAGPQPATQHPSDPSTSGDYSPDSPASTAAAGSSG